MRGLLMSLVSSVSLALHKVVGNSLNDFEKRLAEYEARTRTRAQS